MLVGFVLGGLAVMVAFPLMASAGIDYRTCPVGPASFLIRVAVLWVLAGAAVVLPVRLLLLDPIPFAGAWLLMATLWKYGPFLWSLVPH